MAEAKEERNSELLISVCSRTLSQDCKYICMLCFLLLQTQGTANNQQETSTGSQPLKVNHKRLEASHRSLLLLEQPIQYSHENNHPSLPISSISIVNEN